MGLRAASASKSAARSPVYSSPQTIARRNRILDEARKMICKHGIASVSMDEVAKRASVAKRTLYNAFQSKAHMIAPAINKYFEDYASKIDYSTEDATLDRMIERLIILAKRNLEIKNCSRVLMNIYFSTDVDPETRRRPRTPAPRWRRRPPNPTTDQVLIQTPLVCR